MSTRQDALRVLKERLEGITQGNGFQTDAGASLFIGERPVGGPDDPEASICVMPQADVPGHQMKNVVTALPVLVQAIVKLGENDQPWDIVEAILADIKRAVETDFDLSGTLLKQHGLQRGITTPHDREGGSLFVGATIEYRLEYAEGWGG